LISSAVTRRRLVAVWSASPIPSLLLSPDFEIVGVSDSYAEASLTRPDEIVGRRVFEVFPDNPAVPESQNASRLRVSLERVLAERAPHHMGLTRYDVRDHAGVFVERYWKPSNRPVLDEQRNDVALLLHSATNETGRILRERAIVGRAPEALEAPRLTAGEDFVVGLMQASPGPGSESPIQARLDRLTDRERQVLTLAIEGKQSKLIAFALEISPRTVEVYRANILKKMHAPNFLSLARLIDEGRAAVNDGQSQIRSALRRVREGRGRLKRQYELIEKLHVNGQATEEAEELLRWLKGVQFRFEEHYKKVASSAEEKPVANRYIDAGDNWPWD
jgi:DNA-binding CsgD family transcriptional regulator